MARYRILTWRDIPAQLKVYPAEGRPRSVKLSDWYVAEIDRVVAVRFADLAAFNQIAQPTGARHLPRMRAHSLNFIVESYGGSFERFKRHRAGKVRQIDQPLRAPPAHQA